MFLYISRENILIDSINSFKSNNIANNELKIYYIDEEGSDCGGLLRDWFTSVSDEIVNSGTFKPVPNGTYLTIDERYADEEILKFTGQFIASAYINESNAKIKLASFIWKILLHEKIIIEDMKEYDESIYNSLKWILDNDVSELDEVFVDRNDEELKENGKNIKLTNENKTEYINLILKRTFIGKNERLYKMMLTGFIKTIKIKSLNRYKAEDFREKIIGQETIDLFDWKENTFSFNDDIVDTFFDILSDWSEDDLRKLLKFVTGSSSVPINGFEYLKKLGGIFTIEVDYEDSEKYPEAHTCFNTLVLPSYNEKYELERKLLIAIETVDFGLE